MTKLITLQNSIKSADETAYQLLSQLQEIKKLSTDKELGLTGPLVHQLINADYDLVIKVVTSLNQLNCSFKNQ